MSIRSTLYYKSGCELTACEQVKFRKVYNESFCGASFNERPERLVLCSSHEPQTPPSCVRAFGFLCAKEKNRVRILTLFGECD